MYVGSSNCELFSAAFSGGPIEASNSKPTKRLDPYFPLLLAAAPLKETLLQTLSARKNIFRCF